MNNLKKTYWLAPFYEKCNFESIVKHILTTKNMKINDLLSESRVRKVVEVRKLIAFILHKKLNLTSIEVGKLLGKDHSTILYYCNWVIDTMSVDKNYKKMVESYL